MLICGCRHRYVRDDLFEHVLRGVSPQTLFFIEDQPVGKGGEDQIFNIIRLDIVSAAQRGKGLTGAH
jgi:hypothetical protein